MITLNQSVLGSAHNRLKIQTRYFNLLSVQSIWLLRTFPVLVAAMWKDELWMAPWATREAAQATAVVIRHQAPPQDKGGQSYSKGVGPSQVQEEVQHPGPPHCLPLLSSPFLNFFAFTFLSSSLFCLLFYPAPTLFSLAGLFSPSRFLLSWTLKWMKSSHLNLFN